VRGFDFGGLSVILDGSRAPAPPSGPSPASSRLCFCEKNSMPLACLLTTFSLRASAAGQLSEKSFTSMPNSLAFFSVS
jgi:hypothetical protein